MIWSVEHLLSEYGRVLFAEFFIGSVALLSWSFAARIKPAPVYLRWCAWGIIAEFWLSLCFHVLLAVHCFNFPGAVVVALLSLGLGLYRSGSPGVFSFTHQARLWWRWIRGSFRRERIAWIIAPLVLAQSVICLVKPPTTLDFLTYHGVKGALWVQQGGPAQFDAPGTWQLYRHFFAQGSIPNAWSMLLFHSARLVSATSLLFWPFFCLAVYALALELGIRSRSSWLIAWFLASLPEVLYCKGDGWVDISMHTYILCSIAFALRGFREKTFRLLPWQGMAIGLAAATKVTGLPLAAILMASPLLLHQKGMSFAPFHRRWVLAVVLCAVPVVPWIIYAYAGTGYIFSPLPISVAGITLGKASPEWQGYMQTPIPPELQGWHGSMAAFAQIFCNRSPLRLDPFIVPFLLLAPVGWYRLYLRNWRAALLLSLLTLAFVQFYCSPSFTVVRLLYGWSNGRFFFSAVAWSAILGYLCFPFQQRRADLFIAIVLMWELISLAVEDWPKAPIVWNFFPEAVLLLAVVWWLLHHLLSRQGRLRTALNVFLLIPLSALGSFKIYDYLAPSYRASQPAHIYQSSNKIYGIIDDPRHPYRIAFCSGRLALEGDDRYFQFFGTELQNRIFYIPISADGTIHPKNDPAYARDANYGVWLRRLSEKKIDFVMSAPPRSVEFEWMKFHPDVFQMVDGNKGPEDNRPVASQTGLDFTTDWGFFRFRSQPKSPTETP